MRTSGGRPVATSPLTGDMAQAESSRKFPPFRRSNAGTPFAVGALGRFDNHSPCWHRPVLLCVDTNLRDAALSKQENCGTGMRPGY